MSVGNEISLGELQFTVSSFISFEPDRTSDVFQMAPRVLMSELDLDRSGLLGEGSRASYKLLAAGDSASIAKFGEWINSREDASLRFQDVEQGRPAVQSALVNVRRFLGLAAAVAVLLSGAAVALSARQIAERDIDTSALLRACLLYTSPSPRDGLLSRMPSSA